MLKSRKHYIFVIDILYFLKSIIVRMNFYILIIIFLIFLFLTFIISDIKQNYNPAINTSCEHNTTHHNSFSNTFIFSENILSYH